MMPLGSPVGLQPSSSQVTIYPGPYPLRVDETPIGVGDVDGDGYGDVVWSLRYGAYLIRGCGGGSALARGLSCPAIPVSTKSPTRATSMGMACGTSSITPARARPFTSVPRGQPRAVTVGKPWDVFGPLLMTDLNGDGYSDLYASDGTGVPEVFFGGPGGLTAAGNADLPFQITGFGDFDGDGHLDLVSWTVGIALRGRSPNRSFRPSAAIPVAQGGTVVDLNADGYDDLLLSVAGIGLEFFLGSPRGSRQRGLCADSLSAPGGRYK